MPLLGCCLRRLTLASALLGLLAAPAPAAPELPDASLTLGGVTYLASRAGQPEMRLRAARARYRPETNRIWLEEVALEVESAPGQVGFAMACAAGELDLDADVFVAEGRVRARTQDGRLLATESLRYAHAEGVVASDDPVRIRQGESELEGGGFRYYVKDARFVMRGGARAVQGR